MAMRDHVASECAVRRQSHQSLSDLGGRDVRTPRAKQSTRQAAHVEVPVEVASYNPPVAPVAPKPQARDILGTGFA